MPRPPASARRASAAAQRQGRPAEAGAEKHGRRSPPRPPRPAAAQGQAPGRRRTRRTPQLPAAQASRHQPPVNTPGAGPGQIPAARGRQVRPFPVAAARPERSGPPRVIISKPNIKPDTRPPDEKGRPKLRWAFYESDAEEDVTIQDTAPAEAEPQPAEPPRPPRRLSRSRGGREAPAPPAARPSLTCPSRLPHEFTPGLRRGN